MFLFVLGLLVLFTIVIMTAANIVSEGIEEKQGGDKRRQAAIEERIKPVGEVAVAKVGAAAAAPRSGKEVVSAVCGACHATGALNAPKIGSADAWQPRFDANGGLDGLVKSAIAGKGAMPPRGGGNISDEELRNAITYMLEESGIDVGGGSAPGAAATATKAVQAAAAAVQSVAKQAGEAVSQAAGQAMEAVSSMMGKAPAVEDATGLAQAKGCLNCHQVNTKVVGPAYKDVAAKYAGDGGAVARLAAKVRNGGAGVWGQIPMPPNNVTDEEATKLVKWILSLR
ncbi:MAG: hypothetical protein D6720_05575 [Gammaproteobacteria bacterium]|nr:MAG: hypothetical protein D6720_05575 [Gammaproteobacteria bacterium]